MAVTLFVFLFLTGVLFAYSKAKALKLSSQYEHGPISLNPDANLFYTIDVGSSTASFAVIVNDSNIITNSSNWIGLGISEPTGGSMLGSDVVTAEFSAGNTSQCTFTDRYVPFYAYPLIESIADAPSAFPLADECQHDGSWTLVSCKRSAAVGQMILEVTRPLDAHDDQDRAIPPGLNNFIYAYGSTFAYHGSRRSSIRIILYEKEDKPDVSMGEKPLPDDVDGAILVRATGFEVPSDKATTYACTSKILSLAAGQKLMVVAAEPAVNSSMVHHLTLWLCRSEKYAKLTSRTIECTTGDSSFPGPQGGGGFAQCSTFVYGYAKGMKRLVLPREAGILVDNEYDVLVMETHYDNTGLVSGSTDFSGVRVYYTSTMREHEAGTLLMGDFMLIRMGQTVKNGFQYEQSCTSACTKKFSQPINYYASLLHMHTTGREIYSNKFSANGTFIENMNKVNYWSDNFQNYIVFDPPKQILPGEQVQLSCVFDTSKRPNTMFGLASKNEMCMEFAGYWPVQRDPITKEKINTCAYYEDFGSNMQGTVCGDIAMIDLHSIIFGQNPAFEDTVGAPTSFESAQPTCEVMESATASVSPEAVAGETAETPIPSEELNETTEAPTNSSPGNDNDNACFPASATVQLRDGSNKRMDELQIGDSVLVGQNEFSDVFMFTHRSAQVRYPFVELSTKSGAALRLTRGHFISVNGVLMTAGKARNGDTVMLGSGKEDVVSGVWMVTEEGLYNPHTLHGNIVVDGIVCSTYTHTVVPEMAHSLLVPLRLLHQCVQILASVWCSLWCRENWPRFSRIW